MDVKPLEEREDAEGNDTFDMEAWWKSQRGDLRAWTSVLRAVLYHVPNSCLPERAFSILNDCIDDDQYNAFADYKKIGYGDAPVQRSRALISESINEPCREASSS